MYNIFITSKLTSRRLVAQVSDPRTFLRKHYSALHPVTADINHAIWKSEEDTIEAHRIVEQVFEEPIPVKSDPPKTSREPGFYWCRVSPVNEQENWIICYWDSNYWINAVDSYSDNDMYEIDEHRLVRQEFIQKVGRMQRVHGDERAYAGNLGSCTTIEEVYEQIVDVFCKQQGCTISRSKESIVIQVKSYHIRLYHEDDIPYVTIRMNDSKVFHGQIKSVNDFNSVWAMVSN